MSAHICDCGNHYSSLGALEACQFNNHGDPRPVVAMPDLTAPLAQSIGIVRENAELKAENARLRGIKPKMPPFPPNGSGLPRYGLRWNGPEQPLATPMEDGYWTPWHLADHYKARCERLVGALVLMYDKWENGTPCYEDPEDYTGPLGNAFKLTDAEETQVLQAMEEAGIKTALTFARAHDRAALKDSPSLRTEDRSHE